MSAEWVPIRFIDEIVEPLFDVPPLLTKKPGPPSGFIWAGETFRLRVLISTWVDYGRRGRSARNMRETHARRAAQRGSWGVGRFIFRLETESGRVFDLYYDRAPRDAGDRAGRWVLWRELERRTR